MRAKTLLILALFTLLSCGSDEVAGPVPGDFVYTSVSTGLNHACALTDTGLAYCWGRNDEGQLGDGTRIDRHTPVPVVGATGLHMISAGDKHTCALDSEGLAYCWGTNLTGQLGDGTTESRLIPVPVSRGLNFQSIHPGIGHTCALTPAGEAYCWGEVLYGDLAYPPTPTPAGHHLTFWQLDSQFSLICGLTDEDELYCWGELNVTDTVVDLSDDPLLIDDGLSGYSISVGGGHVCGLAPSGQIECWLGWDVQPATALVGPYVAADGAVFDRNARGTYPLCGIRAGGQALCWRVSTSWLYSKELPYFDHLAEVQGVSFASLSRSAGWGSDLTCGVSLPTVQDPGVFCQGSNYYGELGDGTRERSDVPVKVLLP